MSYAVKFYGHYSKSKNVYMLSAESHLMTARDQRKEWNI